MIYHDFMSARKKLAQGVILISRGVTHVTKGKIEYIEKEQYILYADKYGEARDYTRDLDWCNDILGKLGMKEKKYQHEYIFLEAYNLAGKMKPSTKIEDLNLGSLVPVRCFYRLSISKSEYSKAGVSPKYTIKRVGVMENVSM